MRGQPQKRPISHVRFVTPDIPEGILTPEAWRSAPVPRAQQDSIGWLGLEAPRPQNLGASLRPRTGALRWQYQDAPDIPVRVFPPLTWLARHLFNGAVQTQPLEFYQC